MFDLHNACAIIAQAYPECGVYLVGSSIQRRDFRDVDVRCMLPDEMFDATTGFPLLDLTAHCAIGSQVGPWRVDIIR
jgi:hypothetical protein